MTVPQTGRVRQSHNYGRTNKNNGAIRIMLNSGSTPALASKGNSIKIKNKIKNSKLLTARHSRPEEQGQSTPYEEVEDYPNHDRDAQEKETVQGWPTSW
jgi:hypothetical protein